MSPGSTRTSRDFATGFPLRAVAIGSNAPRHVGNFGNAARGCTALRRTVPRTPTHTTYRTLPLTIAAAYDPSVVTCVVARRAMPLRASCYNPDRSTEASSDEGAGAPGGASGGGDGSAELSVSLTPTVFDQNCRSQSDQQFCGHILLII
jgi:hypothetical protein